jgi:anti-sigma regulatory factor (Ser/Thr protein kinase)
VSITDPESPADPFRHLALLYEGHEEFLRAARGFVQEGLDLGEPVLVAVPGVRLDLVREAFAGVEPERLRLEDMEEMGRNPARIIPAWSDFVDAHDGRPARGIGEPIWRGRSADELVECDRHESLLNLAFADATGFTLLCPYDTSALDGDTLDGAHRNHPHIGPDGAVGRSDRYLHDIPPALDWPLPDLPPHAQTLAFDPESITEARHSITAAAEPAGLGARRVEDLAVALSEAMTNSVVHGGGHGEVAYWSDPGRFVCEVRDAGRIDDPLAGRRRPDLTSPGGRGLWLMNQLCDLVQVRSYPTGQVVRLHITR